MVKNLRIYILLFRVPKKGMSGLPYILKPWSTFLIKYVKLMPIRCQNGQYIQISLLPFPHSEMHCAGIIPLEEIKESGAGLHILARANGTEPRASVCRATAVKNHSWDI